MKSIVKAQRDNKGTKVSLKAPPKVKRAVSVQSITDVTTPPANKMVPMESDVYFWPADFNNEWLGTTNVPRNTLEEEVPWKEGEAFLRHDEDLDDYVALRAELIQQEASVIPPFTVEGHMTGCPVYKKYCKQVYWQEGPCMGCEHRWGVKPLFHFLTVVRDKVRFHYHPRAMEPTMIWTISQEAITRISDWWSDYQTLHEKKSTLLMARWREFCIQHSEDKDFVWFLINYWILSGQCFFQGSTKYSEWLGLRLFTTGFKYSWEGSRWNTTNSYNVATINRDPLRSDITAKFAVQDGNQSSVVEEFSKHLP